MKEVGANTTIAKIKDCLLKQRLLVLPNHEECTSGQHFTMVKVKYTIIDVDNSDTTECVVFGLSDESNVNEAADNAERLFFSKMFLTKLKKDGNQ